MNFGINAISLSKGGGRQIALGYLNYLSALSINSNYIISVPLTEEFKYLIKSNNNFELVNKKSDLNILSRTIFDNTIFKNALIKNEYQLINFFGEFIMS